MEVFQPRVNQTHIPFGSVHLSVGIIAYVCTVSLYVCMEYNYIHT